MIYLLHNKKKNINCSGGNKITESKCEYASLAGISRPYLSSMCGFCIYDKSVEYSASVVHVFVTFYMYEVVRGVYQIVYCLLLRTTKPARDMLQQSILSMTFKISSSDLYVKY